MVDEEGSYEWWVDFSGLVWWDGNPIDLEKKGYVLMQYLDLKDKNGKEIYDGDIVRYTWHEGYLLDDFIGEVWWKDVQWAIGRRDGKIHDINLGDVDELEEDLLNHLEVIGNIYENLELLK